jgi:hypothetical protein
MIKYCSQAINIDITILTWSACRAWHVPSTVNCTFQPPQRAVSICSLSRNPIQIKPISILHDGAIFLTCSNFSRPWEWLLPLRTVAMLKIPKIAHLDLLTVISKTVESMANKFSN